MLSVVQISQDQDISPDKAARSLINLLQKGLVTPDHGTVEEAIADLEHQIATKQWK